RRAARSLGGARRLPAQADGAGGLPAGTGAVRHLRWRRTVPALLHRRGWRGLRPLPHGRGVRTRPWHDPAPCRTARRGPGPGRGRRRTRRRNQARGRDAGEELRRVPSRPPRAGPDHVAIVLDGNGRWAKARGLPRNKGHEAGEEALFATVEGGLDVGLSYLT